MPRDSFMMSHCIRKNTIKRYIWQLGSVYLVSDLYCGLEIMSPHFCLKTLALGEYMLRTLTDVHAEHTALNCVLEILVLVIIPQ